MLEVVRQMTRVPSEASPVLALSPPVDPVVGDKERTRHTWRVSGGGFAAHCRGDEGAGQTSPVTHAVSSSPSSCCPATQSIIVFINIIITPVEQVLRSFPFEQLASQLGRLALQASSSETHIVIHPEKSRMT